MVVTSGADPAGVRKASDLFTEHGRDDRVQIGSPAQVIHALGVRLLCAHGFENGLESGEILSAVHGSVRICSHPLRDRRRGW